MIFVFYNWTSWILIIVDKNKNMINVIGWGCIGLLATLMSASHCVVVIYTKLLRITDEFIRLTIELNAFAIEKRYLFCLVTNQNILYKVFMIWGFFIIRKQI